ncbi:SMI1/KNR4 family protein [Streptomyces sp. NPDC019507]|uniref:SMI1/KNR4 family protein n=1 Tax=Streptomyces sp. NPDC019507 TaxID=3154689 RepID=UPI0033C0B631
MGTTLPSDYKEFCGVFGGGYFCDFLNVYCGRGGLGASHCVRGKLADRRRR